MEGSNSLKTTVLKAAMGYLCEELGDPVRYIPSLRSKGLLDQNDTELIRSQVTSFQKTQHLMEILLRRKGDMNEHPLDILIYELKKQKVQVHIARHLQRTLKKKLKESDSETDGVADGFEQRLHVSVPYQRHQSQSSSLSLDTPSPQSVHSAQPQYEINPNVGPIPDAPPPTTSTSYPQPRDEYVDPEHGLCPNTPPPPSSQFTIGDGPIGPSTPPHAPHHTLTSGMQCMSLNDRTYNGDSETGGQSTNTYPSLATESSYTSYTTDASDIEKEKLLATIQHLSQLLDEEKRKNVQLTRDLLSAKKEVVFSRQELATSRSKGVQSGDTNGGRQESLVRPGTLFPTSHYPEQQQRQYRQASPARVVEAKYSTGSQGDNHSMRSANSCSSVNSNSSLINTSRNQLHSYV